MQSILILTFISAVFAESKIGIHFDCSKLQFWEREKVVCNASTPIFQCAWDIFINRYEMKCVRKPILIRIGNRPTIQGGLHYGSCSEDRYQPFHIVSNRTVDCWYLKNDCIEEGQVLCDNRTSGRDRTCRCDYTNGYAFVQSPTNNFSCIPSEEDCSCYQKICMNENHRLNPEYECVQSYNIFDFNGTCLITEKTLQETPKKDTFSPYIDVELSSFSDPIDYGCRAALAAFCIFAFAILFLVGVFILVPVSVRRTKQCSGEVHEGDDATVEFNIYKVSFLKNIQTKLDGTDLDLENSKYKVTETSNYFCHTYTVEIKNVELGDKGTYECIVSNYAGYLGCKYTCNGKYELQVKLHPEASIVNNTLQQMENHRKDDSYFRTSAVPVALEILKSFNTLIIVGLKGSGKSSLCFEIATHYQDNGFTVLVIPPSDIKNTIHYIRPGKNHLYIFDVNFEKDQDGTIFKTCKDYCQNAKMKFIITTSSNYHTSELSLDLFEDQKQYIRLDSLCTEDKFGILKTHMTKNKVTICDNSYESNYEDPDVIQNSEKPVKMYKKVLDKIIDTHAFTGFPIACKKFFSDRSLLHLEHRYFNSPPKYVIREINSLRNKKDVFDKLKYAVLVYIMINERASVTDIQEDKNLFPAVCKRIEASSWQSFQLKDALEDLEGTVLKCVRNIFEFTHVIMSKAVWMSYIDIDAELCVSACKWSYIEDYISPSTWPDHEYDVCVRVQNSFIITRLVTELSGGSSWSAGQYLLKCYPSCCEFINEFCQEFIKRKDVKFEELWKLCSAFSKVGTSFEVFKKSEVTKEMLMSCNVDQFGNCLMHYCVLQDYEGMLSGIPDSDKDIIINVFNKRGHSPCHLEFYFGRKGMVEKHIRCIPRTYEYYSKLNKLYHVGERNFGRIIETKHLNVIGQMDLQSDILQRAKFGSKQDFKSVKDMLLTLKKETMKMVRIKKISSSVEDTVVANVLATYKCEIIKQYRERHRQKRRITNIETGDRIVICKPFKNPLPRLIEIGHVEVEVEVCLDGHNLTKSIRSNQAREDK